MAKWKQGVLVYGVVGAICVAIYPIIISPMINPEPYRRIQAYTRANIKQEDIQPGNMKVWTDPFERK